MTRYWCKHCEKELEVDCLVVGWVYCSQSCRDAHLTAERIKQAEGMRQLQEMAERNEGKVGLVRCAACGGCGMVRRESVNA